MVHRLLAGCAAIAASFAALGSAGALAANHRVAIGDYHWSTPAVTVNAGEHVTWYWIGPDLMHSVTGSSANTQGIDSDPQTNQPHHSLGDSFQITFSQPGVYDFQCKLHAVVRGEITVLPGPGDPTTEPDPVPTTKVDLTPPRVTDVRLKKSSVRRRQAISTRYSLDERSHLSADFYRYRTKGGRVFSGYQTWKGHIGFNTIGLGAIGKHFRARPGRYMALIRATDGAANDSKVKRVTFSVLPDHS